MLRLDLLDEAKAWPPSEWSASWTREGQLRLEHHVLAGDQLWGHTQAWITFAPPARPKLSLREWNRQKQAEWYWRNIEGQCWISSDGTGRGAPGGPDLAILCEGVGDFAGSPNPCGVSAYLTSEQLLRK